MIMDDFALERVGRQGSYIGKQKKGYSEEGRIVSR